MDANEALNSFDLDPRLFYDAISYSTDDYLYIIDMKTDMALVSENMQQDFDLPGLVFEGLIPRWRELIADRDRQSFDESIDDMLCGKTDEHDLEYQVRNRKMCIRDRYSFSRYARAASVIRGVMACSFSAAAPAPQAASASRGRPGAPPPSLVMAAAYTPVSYTHLFGYMM